MSGVITYIDTHLASYFPQDVYVAAAVAADVAVAVY